MLQLLRKPILLSSAVCLFALAIAVQAQEKKSGAPAKEPPKKSEAAEKAEETYKAICQACHLVDGKGLTPDMSFIDGAWKHGTSIDAMAKVIAEGVPNTVMLGFKDKLTKEEIVELAKIVRAFDLKLKKK